MEYKWRIPYQPWSDDEDMRQRDLAAEAARQWARDRGIYASVVSVNRGHVNLVVRLAVPDPTESELRALHGDR